MKINYKDGETLFKIYAKLKELRFKSYTDKDGVVMCQWGGKWTPYHVVIGFDKRLEVL